MTSLPVSEPAKRLADELEEVLSTAHSDAIEASSSRIPPVIDDRLDAVLTVAVAVIAAIFSLADIGVTQNTSGKGISATNAAFLLVFAILSGFLARYLQNFARNQRQKAVGYLIERLRTLQEDSGEIYKHLPKDITHLFTSTKRGGKWRNVPNNLLVAGDVVALQSGKRTPADVKRICDGRVTFRDYLLGSPTTSREPAETGLEFLELVDMELYMVERSPLVNDVGFFLRCSEKAETTEIGRQFQKASLHLRIVAFVGFILFGICIGVARYIIRPDGYDLTGLILLRSVSLICLLPSLSWSWFRFAFEWYWVKRMQSFVHSNGEVDPWPHMPLSHSAVVRLVGSVTALCGLDEDTLLYDAPAVEEVFLLKGGRKTQVIDCCLDTTGPFGLRFEDPQWKNHLSSLKPIGLACGLASSIPPSLPSAIATSSSNPKDGENASLVEILQERVVPSHFSQLAGTMGFRPEDLQGFNVRARCTIIAGTGPGDGLSLAVSTIAHSPSSTRLSASTFHGKPIVECLVIEVPDSTIASNAALNVPNSLPSNMNVAAPASLTLNTASATVSLPTGPSLASPVSVSSTSSAMTAMASPPGTTVAATSRNSAFQQPLPSSRSLLSPKEGELPISRLSSTSLGGNQIPTSNMASTSASSQPHLVIHSKPSFRNILAPSVIVTTAQLPTRAPTPTMTPPPGPASSNSVPLVSASKLSVATSTPPSVGAVTTTPTSATPSAAVGSVLHVICWGHASLMMQYCSEYWDGESIWSLDADNRKQVQKMSVQWEKEDFDCVAFCYGPLSAPTPQEKALFLGPTATTSAWDDVFIVYRPGMTAVSRPTTPPLNIPASSTTGDKLSLSRAIPLDRPASSGHPVTTSTISPLPATLTPAELQERRIQVICSNLMRGEIFTGMIGSRDQPMLEVNALVEHLHRGGVRFVYFSVRDAKRGRKIAEKMGLETDWNTSISLAKPEECRPETLQQYDNLPSLASSPSLTMTPLGGSGSHQQQQQHGSYSTLYADWELKARMPKGIEAIKRHIVEVDDVPLRVSVFTDCVPGTTAEMVQVMQDHGEVVAGFACSLSGMNSRACTAANVSIAVVPDFIPQSNNEELRLSMDCGRLSSSFAFRESASGILMGLLGEGRVALYNYRQANQCFIALSLIGFVSQCAVFCASSPDMFTLGHILWLVWVQIPLLSSAPALRPRNRQTMLWERMPWKKSAMPEEKPSPIFRFTLYALVRLLPVCAFVCGMFFWSLINYDLTAEGRLNWSAVPAGTNVVFSPEAAQAAQSIALLAFVWAGCFVSASFGSRTETERHLEASFWVYWLFVMVVSVGLQLAYNCAVAEVVVGDCSVAFPSSASGFLPASGVDSIEISIIWVILFVAPPVFVPLVAYPVKKHDRKHYQRAMQMLRLDFETKLGQFSPK